MRDLINAEIEDNKKLPVVATMCWLAFLVLIVAIVFTLWFVNAMRGQIIGLELDKVESKKQELLMKDFISKHEYQLSFYK